MLEMYLDVDDITTSVHFHVGGQWDDTICLEFSGEYVTSTTSVTLSVGHFRKILTSKIIQEKKIKLNLEFQFQKLQFFLTTRIFFSCYFKLNT